MRKGVTPGPMPGEEVEARFLTPRSGTNLGRPECFVACCMQHQFEEYLQESARKKQLRPFL